MKSKIKDISNHRLESLTSKEYKAFINLAENDNLIIQKADKGNNVVILNRQDYIEKMEEILSDKTKFQPINFEDKENKELSCLWDMETAINITLRELRDGNLITGKEYKRLSPMGSQPGILYDCSKFHKQLVRNCPPFRPSCLQLIHLIII